MPEEFARHRRLKVRDRRGSEEELHFDVWDSETKSLEVAQRADGSVVYLFWIGMGTDDPTPVDSADTPFDFTYPDMPIAALQSAFRHWDEARNLTLAKEAETVLVAMGAMKTIVDKRDEFLVALRDLIERVGHEDCEACREAHDLLTAYLDVVTMLEGMG